MNAYADLNTFKSDAYCNITSTTEDTYLRRLLEHASRLIDNEMGRFFYCVDSTRYYDGSNSPWWLPDDILSITTLKTDDNKDATFENSYTENTDYRLYPLNWFPKTKAKIILSGSYGGFASGIDKGIEIEGVFGYGNGIDATPYFDSAGDVADAPQISAGTTTLTLSDDTYFSIGQTLKIDDEQVYVTGLNTGTHTATIVRAVNGTTDADHSLNADIYIYQYPQPIVQACLITAMRAWKRKDSAYQDVVGGGALGTVITSKGIDPDVAMTINQYRKYRL